MNFTKTRTMLVRNVTSSDGCKLYADAVGDSSKPALVFLHGYTLSAAVWDDIFSDTRYTEQFYLVRYDVRGHGRSGKPNEMAGYASKLYADDFAAVCAAFGLNRPIVVAWSLGGTVVADIASHLPPSTLSGIAYLAGCPFIGPVMLAMGTPFILTLLQTLAISDDALTQERALDEFADSCFKDPSTIDWRIRASWRGMGTFMGREQRRFVTTREQDPSGLFTLVSGRAIDPSTKQSLPPLPVLALIGENDAHIYHDKLEAEMRKDFRNLDFVVLPGRGHTIHVEAQEEVMERILDFGRRVFKLPTLSYSSSDGEGATVRDSSSESSELESPDIDGHERVLRSQSSSASLFRALGSVRHALRSSLGYR